MSARSAARAPRPAKERKPRSPAIPSPGNPIRGGSPIRRSRPLTKTPPTTTWAEGTDLLVRTRSMPPVGLGGHLHLRGNPMEQHRTIHMADHLFGDASDHEAREPFAALGRHGDQVRIQRPGLFENPVGGAPGDDQGPGRDAFPDELLRELLESRSRI